MKIIVINGSAESGKDSFVEFVQKYASFKVHNVSSIDPVKKLMLKCGWDPKDKSDEARACMAEIKTVLVDRLDGGFWYINQKLDEIKYFDPNAVVFVHVREPAEIEKLKWAYSERCITMIVERDVRVPDNDADRNVLNYEYDTVVVNDGTLFDLELSAMDFVTFLDDTNNQMAMAA